MGWCFSFSILFFFPKSKDLHLEHQMDLLSLSRFSAIWSGALLAPLSGAYSLIFTFTDALIVELGGTVIVDSWRVGV